MPDNPQGAPAHAAMAAHAHWNALPGHRVITLDGADAVAFAQAQTMNDVGALADGHWQWNGWLNPKGRVIALFALLRFSTASVWLVVADADAVALAAGLRRFVFRSKVAIALREDLQVAGRFALPAQARGAALSREGEPVELDMGGDGGPRVMRIAPAGVLASDSAATLPVGARCEQDWAAFDLAHGWPRLGEAQFEAWTPQQLSLERLRAYSVRKGCYPGQEIVARTHFLGKAKRGLVRLRCTRAVELDEVMAGDSRPVGQFVAAAGDEGLAVMPIDAEGPFTSDGAACEVLSLMDGLAR